MGGQNGWLLVSGVFAAAVSFGAPEQWTQAVTNGGETVTLQLRRVDLRGPNFELLVQQAAGGYEPAAPVEERSYLGSVAEYPGAVSCGILRDDGSFRGAVYFDRGVTWFTLDGEVTGTRALDYANETFTDFAYPEAGLPAAGQAGTDIYRFDVGVDAANGFYVEAGGSVEACFEAVEYSVNNVRALYLKDLLLRPALARVVIRTEAASDPYTNSFELAGVRAEWATNHADAVRDVVCAVQVPYGGGLAWTSNIGTANAYSLNGGSDGTFDVIWRHELGHNWSCSHYVGGSPEGKGIMGGNSPARFSGCEVRKILDYRDKRIAAGGILDNEGIFSAVDLPPYAAMDAERFISGVDTQLVLDVTANDHDANGDAVALYSFDAVTSLSGTVVRAADDRLVYTPPADFSGTDYFLYSVTNPAGGFATGATVVKAVLPADITTAYLGGDKLSDADNWDNGKPGTGVVSEGMIGVDSFEASSTSLSMSSDLDVTITHSAGSIGFTNMLVSNGNDFEAVNSGQGTLTWNMTGGAVTNGRVFQVDGQFDMSGGLIRPRSVGGARLQVDDSFGFSMTGGRLENLYVRVDGSEGRAELLGGTGADWPEGFDVRDGGTIHIGSSFTLESIAADEVFRNKGSGTYNFLADWSGSLAPAGSGWTREDWLGTMADYADNDVTFDGTVVDDSNFDTFFKVLLDGTLRSASAPPQPIEDLAVAGVSTNGSGLTLSWTAEPGVVYSVQTNGQGLQVTNGWSTYQILPAGSAGAVVQTNAPINGDQLFFRVIGE